nr:MAG TPA: hypothetical protein [Caudoviricetes sp.]
MLYCQPPFLLFLTFQYLSCFSQVLKIPNIMFIKCGKIRENTFY